MTWTAPESDGGAEIFNYVIEYRIQGDTKWKKFTTSENIPQTTSVVDGLKEDTYYEFHVAAENRAGVGPFSEPSKPVKTPIVGDEPVLVGVTLKDVTVTAPETATFECGLKVGEPAAPIRWFKATKELYPGDKYAMSYEEEVAKLHVINTQDNDSGPYSLTAQNKVGQVTAEARLTVLGESFHT